MGQIFGQRVEVGGQGAGAVAVNNQGMVASGPETARRVSGLGRTSSRQAARE